MLPSALFGYLRLKQELEIWTTARKIKGLVNQLGEPLNTSTPSGNTQVEPPSELVNPLGEPLTPKVNSSGNGSGKSGNGSSGVSSVKPRREIVDLRVGKSNTGEDYAYILAGIDTERQKKYGEVIYEPHIYPSEVIRVESAERPKWGFLLVEKLPRWRKIVRGIAGFVTLVGGIALLTPFVGPVPAALISGAAALGVRKLLTLGRSVRFSAETADRHLTNGYTPKRDYDIFKRLVHEAAEKVVLNADASVRFQT